MMDNLHLQLRSILIFTFQFHELFIFQKETFGNQQSGLDMLDRMLHIF